MKKFIFTLFILIFGQAFGQNWLNTRKRSILDREGSEVVLCAVQKLRHISESKDFPTLLELAARECCKYDNVLELMEETNKVVMNCDLNGHFVKHWLKKNYSQLLKLAFRQPFKSKTLIGNVGHIDSVLALPNGNIVTVLFKKARIWDIKTGRCLHTLDHKNDILKIFVLPNGIIAVLTGNVVEIWNTNTGEHLRSLAFDHGCVSAIAVCPDNNIIYASSNGILKAWDINKGTCLMEASCGFLTSIAVLPNGNIVIALEHRDCEIWDIKTKKCLRKLTVNKEFIDSIGVLDSDNIVIGSIGYQAIIWDADSGKRLQNLVGHTGKINSISVLPSGNIATVSSDNTVKIWDIKTGRCLHTLDHEDSILQVSVLPNGIIATVLIDKKVRIWDSKTGQCLHTLGSSISFAALANGNIVTISSDYTVKVWNIEEGMSNLISDNGNVTLESLRRVKRLIEESNSSAVAASSSAS